MDKANGSSQRGQSASVIGWLAILQAALGAVLIALLIFGLLPFGTEVALVSALLVHVAGFASAAALSRYLPRQTLVWALSFAVAPAVVTPFAAYEYFTGGPIRGLGFWFAFTCSLAAASFIGGLFGIHTISRTRDSR